MIHLEVVEELKNDVEIDDQNHRPSISIRVEYKKFSCLFRTKLSSNCYNYSLFRTIKSMLYVFDDYSHEYIRCRPIFLRPFFSLSR